MIGALVVVIIVIIILILVIIVFKMRSEFVFSELYTYTGLVDSVGKYMYGLFANIVRAISTSYLVCSPVDTHFRQGSASTHTHGLVWVLLEECAGLIHGLLLLNIACSVWLICQQ